MSFLSYAQNFEDVLLWRALRREVEGFYVDVGAADPDHDSVTRAFYDRGWRGINIEPLPEMAARLASARPRDVNLAIAAGASSGQAPLYAVAGSGLSTLRPEIRERNAALGHEDRELVVPVKTLTEILTDHAPRTIHFMKVDVEGSERQVLDGCDFRLFRPWIMVIEATVPLTTMPTQLDWEPILASADYDHVFFDGLNRYYVAREQFDRLAAHFASPANVFDDFKRAADGSSSAGGQSDAMSAITARAVVAEASSRAAYARAFETARDLADVRHLMGVRDGENGAEIARLRNHTAEQAATIAVLSRQISAMTDQIAAVREQSEDHRRQVDIAQALLSSMHASTSWRVTAPVRLLSAALRGRERPAAPSLPGQGLHVAEAATVVEITPPDRAEVIPSPVSDTFDPVSDSHHQVSRIGTPEPRARPAPARVNRPLGTVHQFHAGSAYGDAITNSMIMVREMLRGMGYRSEIFVLHRDPALKAELRLLEDLPCQPDHVLIVRHSMGYDALDRVLASPCPKILLYHNITPPEFLTGSLMLQEYSRLGRRQLEAMRPHVVAALADSEYNAMELRSLGYAPVRTCTLLFDLDGMRRRADELRHIGPDPVFTVLFTGRVIESKAQTDVVEAYARFRAGMDRQCQLVLVGRTDGAATYLADLDKAMRRHGLEAELVITGLVSDEEVQARFAEASLFLSLSHHEGFGVPLVEAIAHGIPVLAWPAGAVPYTLGGGALDESMGLLGSREPERVAARMLEIARDPERRAALVAAQRAAANRFDLCDQIPALQEALALAGAVPPPRDASREALRANMHFTMTGHVAGSYSLAAVNRALALGIEAERPGRLRLHPFENGPTDDVSGVPAPELPRIAALVARGSAPTGPEVVVSQHFPIHVPATGDLSLAFLFWEETLLPAATVEVLRRGFRAVLAPTAFVAKALTDSGLPIPVRVLGHAPDLAAMEAIGRERSGTPAPAVHDRPITFLHVSSCFPRKGVDVLLSAYARAFRRGDAVRLVIKGFPNPHNTMARDVVALRAADPDTPAIEVVDRDLPEADLLDLYRAADAMVLPTRGEGFNLPAAEAMAAGLPLIVTGHGGHMDFVDAATARLLRWRYAPSGSHLATPNSLWAEPDGDDLVQALRETAEALRTPEGRVALAEQVRRARVQVARRLRRGQLVERLEETSLDLLLALPAQPLRLIWVTAWEVPCGIAEYARQLLRALPDDPAVASHSILSDERWREDARPSDALPHPVRPCWRLGDAASLARLVSAIAAEDPHVVVLQHQPALIAWDALADLLVTPAMRERVVVVTLHNTRHLLEQPEPLLASIGSALERVDRVLVHTLADLERLRSVGLEGNVTLMPHGVKAPTASRAAPSSSSPIIGCYGFFLPGKGIGALIGAVAMLRSRWPDIRLRLVNADYGDASAEEIAGCKAAAREAGLDDAIEWHTRFLPEAESLALLGDCTVIAIPTQFSKESSSASVRDAMAAGPPVLVTPLPIFEELGDAVVRADGITSRSLAHGLEALLRDAPLRAATAAAARAWSTDRSWEVVAHRMQGMLTGLVRNRDLGLQVKAGNEAL